LTTDREGAARRAHRGPGSHARQTRATLARTVDQLCASAATVEDALTRAARYTIVLNELTTQLEIVAGLRDDALRQALVDGALSHRYMAAALGMSRQRVDQLAAAIRRRSSDSAGLPVCANPGSPAGR